MIMMGRGAFESTIAGKINTRLSIILGFHTVLFHLPEAEIGRML